ncbi:hypothetical protein RJ639_038409, partial [Escallonia herrerae]
TCEIMALKNQKLWPSMMTLSGLLGCSRLYSSKPELDMKKLRPMILRRKQSRAKDYPVKPVVQVAFDVLKARTFLIRGVSTLLQIFPIWACRYCPELHIGEKGHLIRTCGGYRHGAKIQVYALSSFYAARTTWTQPLHSSSIIAPLLQQQVPDLLPHIDLRHPFTFRRHFPASPCQGGYGYGMLSGGAGGSVVAGMEVL